MADTSKKELRRRDRQFFRRRQQNRVFSAIAELFAEEAERGRISRKELAEILGKDPSQITRWLSAPSNLELDTISDILLAMGAEMDHRVVRFSERAKSNYAHPLVARYLTDIPEVVVYTAPREDNATRPNEKTRTLTMTASSTSSYPDVEISSGAHP